MTEGWKSLRFTDVFGLVGAPQDRYALMDRVEVCSTRSWMTPNSVLLGCKRVTDKLRLCEQPVVLERRNHLAHFGNSSNLDPGAGDSDAFAGIGEHLAPGIHDE